VAWWGQEGDGTGSQELYKHIDNRVSPLESAASVWVLSFFGRF